MKKERKGQGCRGGERIWRRKEGKDIRGEVVSIMCRRIVMVVEGCSKGVEKWIRLCGVVVGGGVVLRQSVEERAGGGGVGWHYEVE